MTINLLFITLTISRRKKSKEELEKELEVKNRMNAIKEKEFELFRNF